MSRAERHATGRGFTLVELLVALALFALISAFAYRGLTSLLESRAALERESRQWRDVALFVGRLERDLQSVLDRRAASASGTPQAPVSSVFELGASSIAGLAFTRSGSPLQPNALSAPVRVAYRLAGGRIERFTWNGVDGAPRTEPAAVAVLPEAAALTFRYLDPRGEWRSSWGLPGSAEGLPAAVEVTLELPGGERVQRLFDLARG